MPLTVCYEVYLRRNEGRPIFLTRVRDASNALNIARYQVDMLNESWLQRVTWTSSVIEALVEEDKIDSDDPPEKLKQGDVIHEQVQRPFGGSDTNGPFNTAGPLDYPYAAHLTTTEPAD